MSIDFQPRQTEQRPDQFRAKLVNPEAPTGPGARSASFDARILPWMNGQVVSTDLNVLKANGTTLLTGSIEATYSGVGGLNPSEVLQAKSAYQRLSETVLQNGSVSVDDCLTTGKKGDPVILVSLIGHNAKRTSIFVYVVDARFGESQDRHFLMLGGSKGDRRKEYQRGLKRVSYESNRGRTINYR